MGRRIEVGDRQSRLVVVMIGLSVRPSAYDRRRGKLQVGAVLTLCDCGNSVLVREDHYRRRDVKSCGCLKDDQIMHINGGPEKAGLTSHPGYATYSAMVQRCYNPNTISYAWYGARGIEIADEWLRRPHVFLQYLDEVLGPRPAGHTLDRIDPDGHYQPGNIRWADRKAQRRNASSNERGPHLTSPTLEHIEPSTMGPVEAGRRLGVNYKTLSRWADAGRLQCTRTPGGHRRYAIADIEALRSRMSSDDAALSPPQVDTSHRPLADRSTD